MITKKHIVRHNLGLLLAILLAIFTILFYYMIIHENIVNIPFWDEYVTAFAWIHKYLNATVEDKFLHLFSQANEHRIFTYRLAVLSDFYFFGEVNFRHILIFGNISMILLVFALFKLDPLFKSNPLVFLPVILLIFVPMESVSDWGIVILVIVYLYTTGLVSLFFLNKNGNLNFIIAILFAIITTFSFGNGMFIFISGFIVLAISDYESKAKMLVWGSFMILCVALYFTDYNFSAGTNSKTDFLQSPLLTLEIFLTFFSGFMLPVLNNSAVTCTILGSIFFAFNCYLIVFKWKEVKKHPVTLSFLVFIIITVAAMSISRIGSGLAVSFSKRYIIVQVLYISSLYILSINVFKVSNKWFLTTIISVSILVYVLRIEYAITFMERNRALRANGLMSYYINPDSTSLDIPKQIQGVKILDKAIETGYYIPPTMDEMQSDKKLQKLIKEIDQVNNMNHNVFIKESINLNNGESKLSDIPILEMPTASILDLINQVTPTGVVQINDTEIMFAGWAIDIQNDTLAGEVFIDIGGKFFEANYGFPRKGVAQLHGSKFLNSGFFARINTNSMDKGRHKVMIRVLNSQKTSFYRPKSVYEIQINK